MSAAPCTYLDWDSRFFGHRIARVEEARADRQRMDEILHWAGASSIECLYFLVESGDLQTVRLAEDAGFRLVDVRVTLECAHGAGCAPSGAVRPARPADLPDLEAIAGIVHCDSRFYADPRLAPRAPALYRTWIARSVGGDADSVWVAELEGRAAGYVSCHLDAGGGRIGLAGIAPSARGRSLGQALVGRALGWFQERGAQPVRVVTQGRNVAAQRLYQRAGFLTRRVQLWYHRWADPVT